MEGFDLKKCGIVSPTPEQFQYATAQFPCRGAGVVQIPINQARARVSVAPDRVSYHVSVSAYALNVMEDSKGRAIILVPVTITAKNDSHDVLLVLWKKFRNRSKRTARWLDVRADTVSNHAMRLVMNRIIEEVPSVEFDEEFRFGPVLPQLRNWGRIATSLFCMMIKKTGRFPEATPHPSVFLQHGSLFYKSPNLDALDFGQVEKIAQFKMQEEEEDADSDSTTPISPRSDASTVPIVNYNGYTPPSPM